VKVAGDGGLDLELAVLGAHRLPAQRNRPRSSFATLFDFADALQHVRLERGELLVGVSFVIFVIFVDTPSAVVASVLSAVPRARA
jgi:hypothetical protein